MSGIFGTEAGKKGVFAINVEKQRGGYALCVSNSERKILILQKVNDKYTFSGYEQDKLLVTNPSPADLNNDTALDSIVSSQFSNTSSGVVLETKFITPENISHISFGRPVISVAIRRVSGTGTVYLEKINVSVGSITGNTFTSIANADMTPAISSTSDVFSFISGQCFINTNSFVPTNSRFAILLKFYCHVDSAVGEARLNISRGSADSYIEIK